MWARRNGQSGQIMKWFRWVMGAVRTPVTTFSNYSLSLCFVYFLCTISQRGGPPTLTCVETVKECSVVCKLKWVALSNPDAAPVLKPYLSHRGNPFLKKGITHWWAVGSTLICKCILTVLAHGTVYSHVHLFHMSLWYIKLAQLMCIFCR